jgi:hypothetical protein
LLREGQVRKSAAGGAPGDAAVSLNDAQRREINAIIDELTELKKLLAD